jgi:ferredoxin-NADP reductase
MENTIKIKSLDKITPDVLRVRAEKPPRLAFVPGQAADISINKEGWREEKRPFTFTSLPDADHIEFTIKTYPAHKGVTDQLLNLRAGDELILHDVFGDIAYKGEGVFIAGGAGITPFLAIFRWLQASGQVGNNQLIFANKTKADIIHEAFFAQLLGRHFINVLSDEKITGYLSGYITEALLRDTVAGNNKKIYLCGPPPMMDAVEKMLANLHIDEANIIKEGF